MSSTNEIIKPSHWQECLGWSAARVREAFVRPGAVRISPRRVLDALQVRVELSDDNDVSGSVSALGAVAIVTLRRDDASTRKNFTMAHELGHLLHHHKANAEGKPSVYFRDRNFTSGNAEQEAQANRFARELLMPSEWVRQLHQLQYSAAQMGDFFGVSRSAVEVRLGELVSRRAL